MRRKSRLEKWLDRDLDLVFSLLHTETKFASPRVIHVERGRGRWDFLRVAGAVLQIFVFIGAGDD